MDYIVLNKWEKKICFGQLNITRISKPCSSNKQVSVEILESPSLINKSHHYAFISLRTVFESDTQCSNKEILRQDIYRQN